MKTFKRLLAIVLTAALLLTVIPIGTFSVFAAENTTEFAGGDGTAEKPYLISTKEHLNNIRFHNSSYFKMINDIIFSEEDYSEDGLLGLEGWSPISFNGVFDGNNNKIINLKIIKPNQDNVGFVGSCRGSIINLSLINLFVEGKNYVGGICGNLYSGKSTLISNCYVSGEIVGHGDYTGGICATQLGTRDHTSLIEKSYNSATVKGGMYVGGISARCGRFCEISECINSGLIESENNSGGICAYLTGEEFSTYSILNGHTYVYSYYCAFGRISNCINLGTIKGNVAGGILGTAESKAGKDGTSGGIENSYNIGTVSGTNYGGIIGISFKGNISSCLYLNNSITNPTTTYGESITSAGLIAKSSDAFANWDFNSIWTMEGDSEYLYPKLRCFVLSGSVGITGTVAYSEQIKANVTNVYNNNNALSYQWLINGEEVSNSDSSTYTVKDTDVGKKLSVKVFCKFPMNKGDLTSQEFTVSKAAQPASPAVPELLAKDDRSFEISTVSTQEYSINNQNWQAGGKFDNLDPNKEYTVYSRILENNLYFTGESKAVLKVTTDRRPLSGTVAIVGTSRYGDTLSADVSAVLPANATYSYEWKSGGAVVGTDSTYTVVKNDIGKVITVSVKGTNNFIGTVTSAGVTATKTNVQTPAAPTVADKTNVTVTLTEKSGYEYSKDNANWQDSTVFTGLSAATEYTFYQRIKATETTFASSASNGTKVTTLKNSILAPASPTVASKTNTSITLKAESGFEYSKDGLTWQKSNTFTGLNPNTEYSFCQRIAENETDYASATSEFTSVVTLKNSIAAPSAPTVKTATAISVTLNAISGYEYSKDGTTWQKSNTFNGLTLFNAYDFYQRIAETDTDYASPASKALPFKVKNVVSKPNKPTLKEKNNSKIEVIGTQGYEYSIDGKNWVINTVFTGLNPNQTYSVYCRIPETDTEYASDASDALTVTTLKNTVSKPSAPTTSSVKDTSVTLTENSNYEFSKDGITWQKNNTFNGLSPNKEYTFYQRIAETNTAYASEKSGGKKVTTLKSTVNAPAAPMLSSKADVSITLTQKTGYEYSKDGTTWQKSNVFTGLSANTEYSFYQRIAETDTTYASSKSDAIKVITLKHTQSTTPSAPTAKKAYATSVVLYHTEGYEYSKNGTTWQKDNVFTGLSANTEYTFYQRSAETDTTYVSATSPALKVKTAEKAACSITPIKPIITGYTSSSVTLYSLDGYEYSKNGTSWQSSATFNGLSANTTYTFYQRIKETAEEKASDKSLGVSITTAKSTSGSTAQSNFDKLYNYINTYGTANSKGYKQIVFSEKNENRLYGYLFVAEGSKIKFEVVTDTDSSATLEIMLNTYLSKSSKTVETDFTVFCYNYNSGTLVDGVTGTDSFDRSLYTHTKSYSSYPEISGKYITKANYSDLYNASLHILYIFADNMLSDKFGFNLYGLGFVSCENKGSEICDSVIGYHGGTTEVRGKRDATCTIPGYTGDVYCTTCGEKISSGTAIPCTGHHTFDNSCDDTCNVCGEMRYIEHTYSSDCDCECDICHTRRVAPKEHNFDGGETCINCGCPKYTPGDLDGIEGITDADAVYLLMYTFFPEDYPVDQPVDFDGDGNVTDADAIYLLMFTFFSEDYPI